ncbi:MAG TPA: cupredoxin domain-containing protein [Solirubrobacterales bacterium]|nr:cupredoxin domain-containing protein [Solirubrobacterales bacterium]
MRRTVAIVACIALAAALFASQAAPAAGPGPALVSASKTVTIDNFEFTPQTLRIDKGTRVAFSNSSGTAHTATDKGAFDTGRIKAGKSAVVRFQQKGTFAYHCKIHPFMHGKVVVG